MVRPKASQANLQIAAAVTEAATIRQMDAHMNLAHAKVDCKGHNSIFAALRWCLADVVRLKEYESDQKEGVSEVELNKHLCRLGYYSYRYRHRIQGTQDRWSKGIQRWKVG